MNQGFRYQVTVSVCGFFENSIHQFVIYHIVGKLHRYTFPFKYLIIIPVMLLFGCCQKTWKSSITSICKRLRIKKLQGFPTLHSSDPQVAERLSPG